MLSLSLYHGREVIQDMDGRRGDMGPTLGPIDWIDVTYASNIALHVDQQEVQLAVYDECVYYDGMLYGQWSVRNDILETEPPDPDKATADRLVVDPGIVADILSDAMGLPVSTEDAIAVTKAGRFGHKMRRRIKRGVGFEADGWHINDDGLIVLEGA